MLRTMKPRIARRHGAAHFVKTAMLSALVGAVVWAATSATMVHTTSAGSSAIDVLHLRAAASPLPPAAPPPPPRKPILMFDYGRCCYHEQNKTCPVPWDWTSNKEDADVKVYNTLDGMGAVSRDRPGQKLVMLSMESESYYPIVKNAKEKGYDLSMDYRIDSGAELPIVYLSNNDWLKMLESDHDPTKKKQDTLVSVAISNCGPNNGRNEVLRKLIELLPVHSFGSCNHNAEMPGDLKARAGDKWAQKLEVANRYKFHFSFENSNNPGYVTEKVYQPMMAGSLPIYLGAPDIDRFVPDPSSIIKVSDFESLEKLADYIKELAADDAKYLKHFEWKTKRTWTERFAEVLRLTESTAHCRLAMHLAGTPYKWREEDVKAAG